jgi:hypothetical protein
VLPTAVKLSLNAIGEMLSDPAARVEPEKVSSTVTPVASWSPVLVTVIRV